ncbi:UNVERIFIED_CONTAM: Mce-associated membrane protein [Williamsia faeni]
MTGPRKPARPSAPRGKIRVAGSSPTSGKVTGEPAEETTAKPVSDAKPVSTAKSISLKKSVSADKSAPAEKSAPTEKSPQPGAAPADSGSGFLTWRKVLIVAAIALVVGVFAVVAAFKPGVTAAESNLAFTEASATSALKAQAGDRICAVLSVDPTKFDDWANKAKTGLTGEALTQFNEYQKTTRDLAAQSGQGAECKVDMVAVSYLDDSNATVIATLIISGTQQGVAVLTGPGQARTELGLQKVDGQWLISRISDF